ncbi:gliding motility-associated C-terminal domain-containing protein [Pedobacter sp. SYP-B3415]|uniref:T9SS type B sorting domain-containing protein n=1 Tax=Pedobacter sp. SYP-B3415 TaxID=2496641 RepID=UPI00101C5B4D|nr:gliding motility-associated C-terminal domain-containing protein [Pedobacter sp. SYP-B3415]
MVKKLLSFLLLFFLVGIQYLAAQQATFPYVFSFRNSTAPYTFFGGDAPAFLTAGKGPIAGPNGTTFTDVEGNGYLRLTSNLEYQKGYIYNTTSFPSVNGLKIDVEYYTYGGTGADGICFFLFDASATSNFSIGGFGGSLGYSQINIPQGASGGVSKGYLGIGIDEYGNFSNASEGRQGGDGFRPGSVTLRGKGDGMDFNNPANYRFLKRFTPGDEASPPFALIPNTNTRNNNPSDPNYRRVIIELAPANVGYSITVRVITGGATPVTRTIIENYQYTEAAPANLAYGIAASTGMLTNFHEIRNVRIEEYNTAYASAADIAMVTCQGSAATTNATQSAVPSTVSGTINPASIDFEPYLPGVQSSLTLPGQGTFTSNQQTGDIIFTPDPAAAPGTIFASYSLRDNLGKASNPAEIRVTISNQLTADAGPDQNVIKPASSGVTAQLAAVAPAAGQAGTWTIVSTPPGTTAPVFANLNQANTTVSNLSAGEYTFRWTVSGGGACQGVDEVKLTVTEVSTPKIGITKVLQNLTLNSDGTYTARFLFTLNNFGDVPLRNVSLRDDLAATFAGNAFTVTSKQVTSNTNLVINNAYNGSTNTELLSAQSTLAVNGSGTVTMEVRITPTVYGNYDNTAIASGISTTNNTPVSASSTNSATPSPNNTPSPTPVQLVAPSPKIGVTKVLQTLNYNPDGSYTGRFLFTLTNYGNIALQTVSLRDDLAATFAGSTFTVTGKAVMAGSGLTINNAYNGTTDTELLGTASTLAIGSSGQVTLDFRITPSVYRTYQNTAIASGRGAPGSAPVTATSANSATPAPDLPASPTPVPLPAPPAKIGLTKTLTSSVKNLNGSYTIRYLFTVGNYGQAPLKNVSVTDDLATVFSGANFTVVSKTANGTLTVNNNFDGNASKDLLNPASTLAIGATAQINLELNVTPTSREGTFLNTAFATGASALDNTPVTANSANSLSPGPDLPPSATPVDLVVPRPEIGLTKAATEVVKAPDGSYNITFLFKVTNFGVVNLEKISLIDDLADVFRGTTFRVTELTALAGATLRVNSAFNGTTVKQMLDPASTLAVGVTNQIQLKMNVLPTEREGAFQNTAIVEGASVLNGNIAFKLSSNTLTPSQTNQPSTTPVDLKRQPLFISGGFSPNGDGINDKFIVNNAGNRKVSLEVFNRWANRVYKNTTYDNSWDGRCNVGLHIGSEVPAGTYYYVVILDDTEKYVGYITINR